jgi:hypothetical protein
MSIETEGVIMTELFIATNQLTALGTHADPIVGTVASLYTAKIIFVPSLDDVIEEALDSVGSNGIGGISLMNVMKYCAAVMCNADTHEINIFRGAVESNVVLGKKNWVVECRHHVNELQQLCLIVTLRFVPFTMPLSN